VSPKDISGRVLSRPLRSPYGRGFTPASRARWLWLLPIAWLLWVTVISEHSLLRIARLRGELGSARAELTRVRGEATKLDARLDDPRERARSAEEALRRQGMARPGEIIYRLGGAPPDSGR